METAPALCSLQGRPTLGKLYKETLWLTSQKSFSDPRNCPKTAAWEVGKLLALEIFKEEQCAHFGNKTFLEMFNVAPLTIKKGNSHLTLLPLRCEWVQEASPFSSLTLHCRTGRENALE